MLFFVLAFSISLYRAPFGCIAHHVVEVHFSTLFRSRSIIAVQEGALITAPDTQIVEFLKSLLFAAMVGFIFFFRNASPY